MKNSETRREGYGITLKLALPLGLASAGEQLLGFVDTLIAGHLGPTQLATTGLGNALFMAALVLGIGTLSGFETLTAQARGRGDATLVQRILYSRRLLSLSLSVPIILIAELLLQLYFAVGDIDQRLQNEMGIYLWARYLSVPFVLHATVTRSLLQAYERPQAVVSSMLWINLFNIPLNILLATDTSMSISGVTVQGMGLEVLGLGLSTSLLSCFRAYYLRRKFDRVMNQGAEPLSKSDLAKLCRIGIPVGLHWLSEMSIFSLVGLIAGHLGVAQAAAHQVAMTLASLSFTLCLGLSIAGTVRVGYAVGEKDAALARREGTRTFLLALVLMGTSAGVLSIWNHSFAAFFSSEPEVIALAAELLLLAATFQVVDGAQAVMAGNLRGLGATRWAFVSALVGFWAIGFPIALSLVSSLGTVGLWWGLVVGLAASASLQTFGFYLHLAPKRFDALVNLLD